MFTWEKIGKVFTPGDAWKRPWLREFAQAPCALIGDVFVRMYFSCRPPPDANGQYTSRSAFVDVDRNNLFKIIKVADQPILELGGTGCFDEFGTYPVSVIRDGDIVRAYYAGWTRCESVPFNVAIGEAVSRDGGETFSKIGSGPVLGYTPSEPFVLSGPKIRRFNDLWYLWYIAGRRWIVDHGRPEPIYKIRMATSVDGISWSRENRDLVVDRLGTDEAQASPDVFFANGKYHMFFCYRHGTDYRCQQRGYRIGYASSPDLVNWTRDDTKAGINVSSEGWDSEMISYPHLFQIDDTIFMAYLGNQVGRDGFGLARLKGNLT